MKTSQDKQFEQVKEFHGHMDGRIQEFPRLFSVEEAGHRAAFKLEEIIEFLHASVETEADFERSLISLRQAFERAAEKVRSKEEPALSMVGQADALVDLLYFTYGSFALLGIDPKPLFDIVHRANMGKIFPDGKPRFAPDTNKILKPDNWEVDFAPESALRAALEAQVRASQKDTD